MFTEQRIALYKQSLEEAIRKKEMFVIFDEPTSGKFVQFVVLVDDGNITVDIPMEELTETTFNWLKPHMGTATDDKGEIVALQKVIQLQFTQYAAEYTDWIFTKIFQLPETHDVSVNIFT